MEEPVFVYCYVDFAIYKLPFTLPEVLLDGVFLCLKH